MNKYGHYTVGEQTFTNALLAFIEASKTKSTVKWYYHDTIMQEQSKKMMPSVSLRELYRQRAQQLRDNYDYLILQYSGGSDSYTILRAFLDNGIKLDQVCVKLPFTFMDKGLHTPNMIDLSASNYLSEWDFVIKPDLEYLAKHHPEIEIKLQDWLRGISADSFSDDNFQASHGLFFMSHMLKTPHISTNDTEIQLLEQGKKVAIINGVEKPYVMAYEGKCYLTFPDKPMALLSPTLTNPQGTEYFFWTPEMPEIAFQQAHKVFNWFKQNPKYQDLLYRRKWIGRQTERWNWYSELVKPIIYEDWDITRFQVRKPIAGAFGDMSQYEVKLETHPDIMKIKEGWKHHWGSYLKQLDTVNLVAPNGHLPGVDSSFYYLGSFN